MWIKYNNEQETRGIIAKKHYMSYSSRLGDNKSLRDNMYSILTYPRYHFPHRWKNSNYLLLIISCLQTPFFGYSRHLDYLNRYQ